MSSAPESASAISGHGLQRTTANPGTQRILIKNCGLKTPEAVAQAAATGASFAGFIHHHASPRHLELADMHDLVAYARPKLKTVAVLVDPDDEILYDVAEIVRPDFIQLHQVTNAARIAHITGTLDIPVITAIAVKPGQLAEVALLEAVSTHLLFDAPQPGEGVAFDWSLLANLQLKKPWFLAGGLTSENVAAAARHTRAPMVDVSSGIEDGPGKKSLEKIAAFNQAVLGNA